MKKFEKYDGNFKNMDYTFYQMSRQIIKKNKIGKKQKEKNTWQKTKQEMK